MGQAERTPAGENANEFSEPLLDQNGVSNETKLRGIMVQTIADLGAQHSFDDIAKVVQQCRGEANLSYSAEETIGLLRTVLKEAAAASDGEGV